MPNQKQPISLIQAKGRKHLTKAEIESRTETEVKAKSDKIRAPSYLTNDLKREFRKISKELIEIGIMSNLDCDCLARFLLSQKEYVKISIEIYKRGPIKIVKYEDFDEYGNLINTREVEEIDDLYDKLTIQQGRYFDRCRKAASDLGLSISSRCKLVMPKIEIVKENKFNRFVKNGS